MPTEKESLCCQELHALNEKLDTGIDCICDDEDFRIVCIHRAVLRTALAAMSDVASETVTEPLTNKSVSLEYVQKDFTNNLVCACPMQDLASGGLQAVCVVDSRTVRSRGKDSSSRMRCKNH